jgi:hypothetical protein
MAWLGKVNFSKAAVAMVMMGAWFAGTHHCLLGLFKRPGETIVATSQCSGHCSTSGGAPADSSGMLACCQGLQSTYIAAAKAKISFCPVLLATQLFVIAHLFPPETPQSISPTMEYDTGPPSGTLFVETVLKRSLCENAPPGNT